jgi:hypothetical protein
MNNLYEQKRAMNNIGPSAAEVQRETAPKPDENRAKAGA